MMRTTPRTLVAAGVLAAGIAAAPMLWAHEPDGPSGQTMQGGQMGGGMMGQGGGMPMMQMMQRMNRMMDDCEKMMGAMRNGQGSGHPHGPSPQQAPPAPEKKG